MAKNGQKTVEELQPKVKPNFSIVVYCNKENSERVKLILRSYCKNLLVPFNVVVFGEKFNWMNEKVSFIPFEPTEPVNDIVSLLVNNDDVAETFAIIPDSTFMMNQAMMAHLLIPYAKSFSGGNNRFVAELSEALPFVYSKESLKYMSALPDRVLYTHDKNLCNAYYNNLEFQTMPLLLNWVEDSIMLPVVSVAPSESLLLDYASKKLFFNISDKSWPAVSKFIKKAFPVASDFEAPVKADV